MERFNQNEKRKEIRKESTEFDNEVVESKACHDICRDLSNLSSQVQMMSDSLLACMQLPKYRPLRKAQDASWKKKPRRRPTPEASFRTLFPVEDSQRHSRDSDSNSSGKDAGTSQGKSRRRWKARESNEFICQQVLTKINFKDWAESCHKEISSQTFESSSTDEFWKSGRKMIKARGREGVHPQEMIDLIRGELKTLLVLAPSVSALVVALSERILHYKECARCSEKISPSSLSWILNRIQELILYVVTKRKENFRLPTTAHEPRRDSEENPAAAHEREFCKLEEVDVDAAAILEAKPGVQILLRVEPEKHEKKFFAQANRKFLQTQDPNFPIVQFSELRFAPLVQVLKAKSAPECETKRGVSSPRCFSFGVSLLFPSSVVPVSYLVVVPVARAVVKVKRVRRKPREKVLAKAQQEEYIKPLPSFEELSVRVNNCHPIVYTLKTKSKSLVKSSNVRKAFGFRKFLANAPDLVKELLKEAEEERMELRKVEAEVQSLKDLMAEVHRNQIRLSQVLLQEGVYSQPLIKLTNPNMLEEEDMAVRKVSEMSEAYPGSSICSSGALRALVQDLKQKCNLKNKLILTLIKGLQSNVPKEWWEEIVSYTFEEVKPMEELDYEKIDEFIRQTSLFLTDDEKVLGLPRAAPRVEDQPSEEEPDLNENLGAIVEENLENLSRLHGEVAEAAKGGGGATSSSSSSLDLEGILGCQNSLGIFAFPAATVPKGVAISIRKLENQVSLLNAENERLWHEVHELRDLFKSSVKQLKQRVGSSSGATERVSDTIKTSGKTINLTIQIGSDKSSRRPTNITIQNPETEVESRTSKNPSHTSTRLFSELKKPDSGQVRSVLDTRPKFHLKSERRRSQNDLNYLDDFSPIVPERREKAYGRSPSQSVQQIMMATPHPSNHHFFRTPQPPDWAPKPTPQAGPSRKLLPLEPLVQKPSLTKLAEGQGPEAHASVSNERELLPILEYELAEPGVPSSGSSGALCQAIQHLRTRVRSIHKEVTVLKSKNDRIDKLLDRLMDDAVDNNKSYEEIENSLKTFNDRLG